MAAKGVFTYRALYGGKPESYHQKRFSQSTPSTPVHVLSESTTTTDSLPTIIEIEEFISTTTTTTTTTTIQTTVKNDKISNLVQLVPFAYFHWFLLGLAILLLLLLTIIFTYYCRQHCRKKRKSRNEKKQPLPSFYRYRTKNRPAHTYNIFDPTTPLPYPSPARPCPPKSSERINNKLLRQGLDAVGSPQVSRMDLNGTGPSNTFSSAASDLLTEIKGRLSMRSSESSLHAAPVYETQRANMALNDDSLLIDMN